MIISYIIAVLGIVVWLIVTIQVWFWPRQFQETMLRHYARAGADPFGLRRFTYIMFRSGVWLWVIRVISIGFLYGIVVTVERFLSDIATK